MEKIDPDLDRRFIATFDFLLRNPSLMLSLYKFFQHTIYYEIISNPTSIARDYYSKVENYVSGSEFIHAAHTIFRALDQVGLLFECMGRLSPLAGYKDENVKLEILLLLEPEKKGNRRKIRNITYRRRVTRALGRLHDLGLIIWRKRKRFQLTADGARLRKAILQAQRVFKRKVKPLDLNF